MGSSQSRARSRERARQRWAAHMRWLNRWPDRTGTVNYYNNLANVKSNTFWSKVSRLNSLKHSTWRDKANRTRFNSDRDWYNNRIGNNGNNGNPATGRERELDIEEGNIRDKKGEILTKKAIIRNKKQYLSNELATGYSIYLTKKGLDSKEEHLNEDTKQRRLDIYNTMTLTNNSLENTITRDNNNQTTDDSNVFYQMQQTDNVRTTNTILLILYLILVIAYAMSLYFWAPFTNLRMKMITIILLLAFPYLTYFYYNIDFFLF